MVCREMNCGDPNKFSGSSSPSKDIGGLKLSCTGRESSVTQCTLRDYARTSNNIVDASVECSGMYFSHWSVMSNVNKKTEPTFYS